MDESGDIARGRLVLCELVTTKLIERDETRDGQHFAVHRVLFPGGVRALVHVDYLPDELGDNLVLPGTAVNMPSDELTGHGQCPSSGIASVKAVCGHS